MHARASWLLAALVGLSGCYLVHEPPNARFDGGQRLDAGRDARVFSPDAPLLPDAGRDSGSDAGGGPTRDAGADAGGVPLCEDPGAVTPEGVCARGCDEAVLCVSEMGPCCRTCVCRPRVRVEPGEYWRGSPLDEAGREADEVRHRVRLTRAFQIDRTEVTQAEWSALMGSEPSSNGGCPQCPVETINQYEAMLFANARSDAEGLERCYGFDASACSQPIGTGCPPGGVWRRCTGPTCFGAAPASLDCEGWRLPTEAEWEFAARAGSDTAFPAGNDQELANVHGWCSSAGGEPHPVGQKAANPWGLLDIIGNVYEWTGDAYADYVTEPQPVVDPVQPVGQGAVMRGGSFAFGDSYCRSANRGAREATSRENVLGFRLVRTLPEP